MNRGAAPNNGMHPAHISMDVIDNSALLALCAGG
jgi:hypothetical protein